MPRHRHIRLPPTAVLVLVYATLIVLGTVLLALPQAAHQPTAWADALFTATSAVTVTGLVVVDTGSHYTLFGQIVIALLIQLGGLGIVTFAVLVLCMLGLPISLQHKLFLRDELNQTSTRDLLRMALVVLRVVLVFEAIGTAALACVFIPEFGWWQGLWQALFHTISAFNNAGFGLFPDSLSRWAGHPLVNLVVPLLFVIGGLGFSVLTDLRYTRGWRRLSLHSKLTLAGSAGLIAWSVLTFAVIEWSNPNTLGTLGSAADKLMASIFQALTPRTAGFNTLPIDQLEDASALMTILLMLIGGGSASTAGGIKITTFAVMLLATAAWLRRRANPVAFGRSLGGDEVMKVLALISISLIVVMTATFILTLTQQLPFLMLLFEVASAFGTVGLSMGATGEVDAIGRAVLIVLMFLGRVGPLALGLFLATRTPPRVRYPAGQIFLG
ncbi:MAG: TrkH family potassium uptake protein [Wenzhouxiangellaceae bacterium]|nr:TrkH family potassium uptake protein [Wenzhouxiangellaceae bacterium]